MTWLWALVIASAVDLWFTSMALAGGGSELNPVVAGLLRNPGWLGVIAGKAVAVAAGWGLWRLSGRVRLAAVGLRVVTWVTVCVVLYSGAGLVWGVL